MDHEQRNAVNEKEQNVSRHQQPRRWAELAETLARDADRSGQLVLAIKNALVWDRVELAFRISAGRDRFMSGSSEEVGMWIASSLSVRTCGVPHLRTPPGLCRAALLACTVAWPAHVQIANFNLAGF